MLEKAKRKFKEARNNFPWGYSTLESDPRGAKTRSSKQSQEAEPTTPEVITENQLQVLNYLVEHLDTPVSYEDISRGSGVSRSKVGRVVNELVSSGTVVRSKRSRQGTRYWINSGGPNSEGKSTEQPSIINGSEEDNIDFVKTTHELVFQFIRATRSTDLLLYLTWLETQGDADGS